MKAITAIFAFSLFFLTQISAQQLKISADFQDEPLPAVFDFLKKTHDLTFSFDPALLHGLRVTANFQNAPLNEALAEIFKNLPLTFQIVRERNILVLPAPDKKITASPAPPPVPQRTVCGTVRDGLSSEPLPFANLVSLKNRQGTAAGDDGFFRFSFPEKMHDSLVISYLGFKKGVFPATVFSGKNCPDLFLKPFENGIGEVVVVDKSLEQFGSDLGTGGLVARPPRLGLIPGLGEPDPLRMLQFLPGVQPISEKADDLSIRGGMGDQNQVLWEDIPIYHTGHLSGAVSSLHPEAVDEVKVWKGHFSPRFGGRTAGIIEMRRRDALPEKMRFGAGLNLVSTWFSAELPLSKKNNLGLFVAGRRSFSEAIESGTYRKLFAFSTADSKLLADLEKQKLENGGIGKLETRPVFYDLNAKISWQPSPRSTFNLSVYHGADHLKYFISNDTLTTYFFQSGDSLDLRNFGASAVWKQNWSAKLASNVSLVYSDYGSRFSFGHVKSAGGPLEGYDHHGSRVQAVSLRYEVEYQPVVAHSLLFGGQILHDNSLRFAHGIYLPDPDDPFNKNWWVRRLANSPVLYANWRFAAPARHWDTELGLRYNPKFFYKQGAASGPRLWENGTSLRDSAFSRSSQNFLEPRLAVRFYPFGKNKTNDFFLKINGGLYHQILRKSTSWNELNLADENWVIAEVEQFPVLRLAQGAAGFSFSRKNWLFDAEFFQKKYTNLAAIGFRKNTQRDLYYDNSGSENVRGADILLKRSFRNGSAQASYSFTKAETQFDGIEINGGLPFPSNNSRRHGLSTLANFQKNGWAVSVAWIFRSGKPYSPATGIYTDSEGVARIEFGKINSLLLPNYQRFDLSLHRNFNLKKTTGMVGISVFNLLDRKNVAVRDWSIGRDWKAGQLFLNLEPFERNALPRTFNFFWVVRL